MQIIQFAKVIEAGKTSEIGGDGQVLSEYCFFYTKMLSSPVEGNKNIAPTVPLHNIFT